MKEEVEELRRQLHEVQECEVNSEQRVQDLIEEHKEVKIKFSDLQEQLTMITPAADGIMVIAVENHNYHPTELEEGQLLGSVEPVNILLVATEVCALEPAKPPTNTEGWINEVL